jgi:urease alpha subunit
MTQHDRAARASELDVLVAGVLLVDPLLGVVKTNIGIKDGRIAGIGRAGNLDGRELAAQPVHDLPLSRRYLLA